MQSFAAIINNLLSIAFQPRVKACRKLSSKTASKLNKMEILRVERIARQFKLLQEWQIKNHQSRRYKLRQENRLLKLTNGKRCITSAASRQANLIGHLSVQRRAWQHLTLKVQRQTAQRLCHYQDLRRLKSKIYQPRVLRDPLLGRNVATL